MPPKYRRIAADLAARIRSGEYRSGAALPPQRALSESYGVTLMTLRQALQVLEDDGLVRQQAGRGTFVGRFAGSAEIELPLQNLESLGEALAAQGVPLRTQVLGRGVRKLPPGIRAELETTDPQARGLRLERLRSVHGRPVLHQVSWVPEPQASGIQGADLEHGALYTALAEAGTPVARADEELSARALSASVAAAAGLAPGLPVLTMRRRSFGADGRPLVADTATVLDRRLHVVTERRPAARTWSLH